MFQVIIDHKQFSADLKAHGQDLRSMSRRIVSRMADELVDEFRSNLMTHNKTNEISDEIEVLGSDPWSKVVFLGDAHYLDKGSEPHGMPVAAAEEMASYYGKTPWQFWNMVKLYGTRPHPFIDKSFEEVMNRREQIYQDEIDKLGD